MIKKFILDDSTSTTIEITEEGKVTYSVGKKKLHLTLVTVTHSLTNLKLQMKILSSQRTCYLALKD